MDPEPSPVTFLLSLVNFDFSILYYLLSLLVLLFLSAMVSGAEVAFFSVSRADLDKATEEGDERAKDVAKLLQHPDKLLATILISNNFINVGIVVLTTFLNRRLFDFSEQPVLGFLVEVVSVTFLILIFGEVIPKVYANRNPIGFAGRLAVIFKYLMDFFSFLSVPMMKISKLMERKVDKKESNISVSHLSHALELTADEETTQDEQKILEGIVSFGKTDSKQIMTPRIDMFALDILDSFDKVLSEIISHGFSRIPVYSESPDSIKGILYAKDLLPFIGQEAGFDWTVLIREAFYVPENKKIDDLLSDFQKKKVHLAIVVDEYGGTSGVVSLEDILEEIVGEISDEFDDEDIIYSKMDDSNYIFEGKTTLKDFYRVIEVEDEDMFENQKGESDTLAGFVLEIAGEFPKINEEITFKNYSFLIEALDRKRIKQIKVTVHEPTTDQDE